MRSLVAFGAATLMLAAGAVQAQEMRSAADWCRESGDSRDRARAPATSASTRSPRSTVNVDAGKNGGVRVIGGQRADTLVRARVVATAETQADADALAGQVKVSTDGGTVSATGPDRSSRSP